MIVWNKLSIMIFFQAAFLGTMNFRPIRLPIIMTRIPASVNRIPANSIWLLTASTGISNRLYPILIQGNALPHSAQQIIAIRHSTGVFFNHSPFFDDILTHPSLSQQLIQVLFQTLLLFKRVNHIISKEKSQELCFPELLHDLLYL